MTLYNNNSNNPSPCGPLPDGVLTEAQARAFLDRQDQEARRLRDTASLRTDWCAANFDACKCEFARCCRAVCPGFRFDPARAPLYSALVLWACRLPDSPYPPDKGLFICGNIGVGKSTLLAALALFLPRVRYQPDSLRPLRLTVASCRSVCALYQSSGLAALCDQAALPGRAYDELGAEPPTVGYFGSPINVMACVLDIRYEQYVAAGDITLVTTNLAFSQLADAYGPRIADRCTSMFSPVEILGRSLRR